MGHFWQFLKFFIIFLKFFRVFWSEKWAKKNFLEKCHFLVPKIGFTQFRNDLGHIWQFLKFGPFLELFKIFSSFLKFFSFLVWKIGEKNFLENCHFLVPKLLLPSFWMIWGHFGNFLNFSFFESFPSFLVWKMGEKKFLEKCHFLVPKIGSSQFLNDLGHFWQFLKFGPFLALFKIFDFFEIFSSFFGLKNGRKKFLEKCHF